MKKYLVKDDAKKLVFVVKVSNFDTEVKLVRGECSDPMSYFKALMSIKEMRVMENSNRYIDNKFIIDVTKKADIISTKIKEIINAEEFEGDIYGEDCKNYENDYVLNDTSSSIKDSTLLLYLIAKELKATGSLKVLQKFA